MAPVTSMHISTIDAEPLRRYRTGGYYTVTLVTLLHDGRYRILQKLDWGRYSTVWTAMEDMQCILLAQAQAQAQSQAKILALHWEFRYMYG